jgi:hypothetical protein
MSEYSNGVTTHGQAKFKNHDDRARKALFHNLEQYIETVRASARRMPISRRRCATI